MTPFRRLLEYFARFKRSLVLGALCVVGSSVFSLLKPLIIGSAVDTLSGGFTREQLVRYGLLLIGAASVEGLFLFLLRWILIGTSRRMEYEMRNDFYSICNACRSITTKASRPAISCRGPRTISLGAYALGPA